MLHQTHGQLLEILYWKSPNTLSVGHSHPSALNQGAQSYVVCSLGHGAQWPRLGGQHLAVHLAELLLCRTHILCGKGLRRERAFSLEL